MKEVKMYASFILKVYYILLRIVYFKVRYNLNARRGHRSSHSEINR